MENLSFDSCLELSKEMAELSGDNVDARFVEAFGGRTEISAKEWMAFESKWGLTIDSWNEDDEYGDDGFYDDDYSSSYY